MNPEVVQESQSVIHDLSDLSTKSPEMAKHLRQKVVELIPGVEIGEDVSLEEALSPQVAAVLGELYNKGDLASLEQAVAIVSGLKGSLENAQRLLERSRELAAKIRESEHVYPSWTPGGTRYGEALSGAAIGSIAVSDLIDIVKDREVSSTVRESALYHLEQMGKGAKRAEDEIIALLDAPEIERSTWIRLSATLKEIKADPEKAVPKLIPHLRGSEVGHVAYSINNLIRNQPLRVGTATIKSLVGELDHVLDNLSSREADSVLQLVNTLGEQARPLSAKLLGFIETEKYPLDVSAAWALSKVGLAEGVDLSSVSAQAFELLGSEYPNNHAAGSVLAFRLGLLTDDMIPSVCSLWSNSKAASWHKTWALLALGKITPDMIENGSSGVEIVFQEAGSKSKKVQEAAIFALRHLATGGWESAEEKLKEMATSAPLMNARQGAVIALSQTGGLTRESAIVSKVFGEQFLVGCPSEAIIETITLALSDKRMEVRITAAEKLGALRERATSAISELEKAAKSRNKNLKAAATLALKLIRTPKQAASRE